MNGKGGFARRAGTVLAAIAALGFTAAMKTGDCGRVHDAASLKRHLGKCVILRGSVSRVPWQHLVGGFRGYPHSEYFDSGKMQIIVYSRTPMKCPGEVDVTGTVREVKGLAKGPEPRDVFREYHITADSWECVKAK